MFYNLNESERWSVTIQNKKVELQPLQEGDIPQNPENTLFIAVGQDQEDTFGQIFSNVCRHLEDLSLPYERRGYVSGWELDPHSMVLILCSNTISDHMDPQVLEQFIKKGGKAVLAAGISSGNEDAYLDPVLGLVEKTVSFNPTGLHFPRDYFPVQDEVMGYNGYVISTWVSLREKAEIYAEDSEKHTPIIYSYPYGAGETLVLNGTYLADQRCIGMLTAGLSVLLEDFMYPVLGLEHIYLDNFPLATNADDASCLKLYGRTTEAFVRDIVWPSLQGISVRNGIKYTSSVLAVSTIPESFPSISEGLFTTMGKSALQFDVELAYASFSNGSGELYAHQDFIERFHSVFKNYNVSSLITTGHDNIPQAVDFVGEEIHAVRGDLRSQDVKARLWEGPDYFVFPCGTEGTELDQGTMLEIASLYAGYGMLSHKLDINNFVDMHAGAPVWDTEKRKLAEFEERVLSRFKGLDKKTLSGSLNPVRSYLNLNFSQVRTDDTWEILCDDFIPGQSFLVHTKKEFSGAEGAELQKVGSNYYMVRVMAPRAVLHLAKGA